MSYHCSTSDPFVRVSRTLAAKLQTGVINKDEFAVLTYMMLKADLRTGQLITKSTLLAEEMGMDRVDVRNILGSLKTKGFIQNPDRTRSELSQKKGSTKSYPIYICDYPVIGSEVRSNPEDRQSQVRHSDRVVRDSEPQSVENIETEGNLAKKPIRLYKIREEKEKIPDPGSISYYTGDEENRHVRVGTCEKTEDEIEYVAKQLRYHSVKPQKARWLAERYPRETIFRHIKQIKYDYCSGQHWRDPGAVLVWRIKNNHLARNYK